MMEELDYWFSSRDTPEQVERRTRLHSIICARGHEAFSGDKLHHMSADNMGPCTCGAPRTKIVCPPGCSR